MTKRKKINITFIFFSRTNPPFSFWIRFNTSHPRRIITTNNYFTHEELFCKQIKIYAYLYRGS